MIIVTPVRMQAVFDHSMDCGNTCQFADGAKIIHNGSKTVLSKSMRARIAVKTSIALPVTSSETCTASAHNFTLAHQFSAEF